MLYLLNVTINSIFKFFLGKKVHFLALLSFYKMYSAIRIELKLRRSQGKNKYSLSLFQSVEKIKDLTEKNF
jgi:hypothetical protein